MSAPQILVIDDDAATCELLKQTLTRRGYGVGSVTDPEDALETLATGDYQVVVTDVHMEKMSGVEVCRRLKDRRPDVPVIIMTGFGNQELVVDAIRAGAHDFIAKPFEVAILQLAIDRAIRRRELEGEIRQLRSEMTTQPIHEKLIGRSQAMTELSSMISRAAPSEASVMIVGESGTGKELVARAIHESSRRAAGPFVAINCGALPETLLESELFGHTAGAFTDANVSKPGLFVAADGGTIFLDEVAEMPLSIQVKLLRSIQERRVRPVGSSEEIRFNARLITATNRDIDSDVEEGRFRGDLFYRLNVLRIFVPALRARGNDVLALAQHFLTQSKDACAKGIVRFSRDAIEQIVTYPFPGNVRELENMVQSAIAMAEKEEIDLHDLPDVIRLYRRPKGNLNPEELPDLITVDELERRYIGHVLLALSNNRTQAATVLRMDRKTLYRKLRRWAAADKEAEAAARRRESTRPKPTRPPWV